MGVQGGDDDFMLLVLKISEFFGEKPGVMVIEQSYGSDDERFRSYNRRSHKPIAYQIPKRLGSVVIAFFSDELVKAIEEIRV